MVLDNNWHLDKHYNRVLEAIPDIMEDIKRRFIEKYINGDIQSEGILCFHKEWITEQIDIKYYDRDYLGHRITTPHDSIYVHFFGALEITLLKKEAKNLCTAVKIACNQAGFECWFSVDKGRGYIRIRANAKTVKCYFDSNHDMG